MENADEDDEERLFGVDDDSDSDSAEEKASEPKTTLKKEIDGNETPISEVKPTKTEKSSPTNVPLKTTDEKHDETLETKSKTRVLDDETRRLFGDSESSSSDSEVSASFNIKSRQAQDENTLKDKDHIKETDEQTKEVSEELITVEPITLQLPKQSKPYEGSNIRYSRLPNLLHLSPAAFEQNKYSEEKETAALKKLGKEFVGDNIIRWRYKRNENNEVVIDEKTNKPVVESNARFVEWSDGSLQLLIGAEVLDVVSMPLRNQFLFAMGVDEKSGKTCLESHGRMNSDMRFRPTGLSSSAHKDLEMQVKAKNLKTVKIIPTSTMIDPEKEQEERAKAREEVLRLQERQRAKAEHEYGRRGRNKQWTERFLEEGADTREYEEEEEYGLSVNAIKAKYKGPRLTEDEEEDEEDEFLAMDRSAKRRKMKKAKPEALKAIEKKSDQPEVKDKVSDETTSKEKDESKKRSVSEHDAPISTSENVDEDIVQPTKKRRANLIESDEEESN